MSDWIRNYPNISERIPRAKTPTTIPKKKKVCANEMRYSLSQTRSKSLVMVERNTLLSYSQLSQGIISVPLMSSRLSTSTLSQSSLKILHSSCCPLMFLQASTDMLFKCSGLAHHLPIFNYLHYTKFYISALDNSLLTFAFMKVITKM